MKKILIPFLLTTACPSTVIAFAQSAPKIKIGLNTVSADPVSGIKLPYWLNATQTLAADQDVSSISVMEFTVDGTDLKFSQIINVTTVQTVPAGKVWKIESIGFAASSGTPTNWSTTGNGGTTAGTNFIGTTNTQDLVLKTNNNEIMRVTNSGNVGIGQATPTAKLEVAGQVKITGGSPGANKVLVSDASGLASWSSSAGKIVNVTYRVSSSRVALGSGSAVTLEAFTVDKKSPTSYLLIQGTVSGKVNNSGSMQQGWKYGTASEVLAQSLMYESTVHSKLFPTTAVIAGYTTTGAQTLTFRYFDADGTSGNGPFGVYNPNSSDDGRIGQTSSVYVVWEIEP